MDIWRDLRLGRRFLPSKKYLKYEVNSPTEVVSMTGNIAWMKNDVVIHCHGVFSNVSGKTTGGHFVEGVVGPTLEVMVLVGNEKVVHSTSLRTTLSVNRRVERLLDDGVGLNLLDI